MSELDDLIKVRQDLIDSTERVQSEIDGRLAPVLAAYFDFRHELGLRTPCAPEDYRFDYMSANDYVFSHECMDHGYDLPDRESVELPGEFLTDREAYTTRRRAEVEADNKREAEKRREQLRRELAALEEKA